MERWLPLALFGLVMGALMIVLSRYQATRYQRYLSQHVASSEKLQETQRDLIAQQERSIAIAERSVMAMERIASALEQRKP